MEDAMKQIAEYQGGLLNHLNLSYRAGDRDLAVELMKAIGLTVMVTEFTDMSLISAHPNAEDMNLDSNVIFLLELPAHQAKLDAVIRKKAESDPELAEALDSCRERARSSPDRGSHIGVRCTSNAELDSILDRLSTGVSKELGERITVVEMPRHEPVPEFPSDIRQIFVHTDVVLNGATAMGQNIELQAIRS
jgi:hypothetical protein